MSSEKPDQIQASVAAALSRLRGDLGPSGATAPKLDEPTLGDRGLGDRGLGDRGLGDRAVDRVRPANDVRGDPFFRSIQPPPGTGMAGPGRAPIPITPFSRMQAPQEPTPIETPPETPPETPLADEAVSTPEPEATIEIPAMPERSPEPDLASMLESSAMSTEPTPPSTPPSTEMDAPVAMPQPPAPPAGPVSPLSRVMRGPAPGGMGPGGATGPAQRDLLASLPPPPISEPLTAADTESSAMRRRRRNRRLLGAAAIIIVAAIGVWLWSGSEPSTEIPVVAAESTPEKVKPADEGGLQVPNQNVQVLENMDGAPAQTQAETVLPEPEQPVAAPVPSAEQAPTVVENAAPDSNGVTTSEAPVVSAPAVDVPVTPETPLAETPLPEMTETEAAGAAAPAPAESQPAPATPAPEQTAEAPATTVTPEPAPAPAAAEPATAPAPAPEPVQAAQPEPTTTQEAAVTPVAPTGNTKVQLAAGKSEASVQKEWAAMQKAHPALLGSLSLTIQRVDKGAAGIFYRLQAGPLADKRAAQQLCASLKQRNQDCIVVTK
jgi:hypothetical protein